MAAMTMIDRLYGSDQMAVILKAAASLVLGANV
jgi:hypothetical protein